MPGLVAASARPAPTSFTAMLRHIVLVLGLLECNCLQIGLSPTRDAKAAMSLPLQSAAAARQPSMAADDTLLASAAGARFDSWEEHAMRWADADDEAEEDSALHLSPADLASMCIR